MRRVSRRAMRRTRDVAATHRMVRMFDFDREDGNTTYKLMSKEEGS